MAKRTIGDVEKVWSNVQGVKKLSDRVLGIGPFGIGLDGLLTWVPVAGLAYTVGAGGWLLLQAGRARASPGAVVRMLSYLGLEAAITAVGEIPFLDFVPNVADVLFPGHLLAARALQQDIESTHWIESSFREAQASGEHERHLSEMRSNPKLKRVVYLHD